MTFSGRYQPLSAEAPETQGGQSRSAARDLHALDSIELDAGFDDNEHDQDDFTTSKYLRPFMKFMKLCTGMVRANAGLLLVASAQGFFALMNVAVKKLNSLDTPVPTLELIIVRMGITYICCISYMHWKSVPDPFLGPKDVRFLLLFRGFSGFFGLFGVYYSLQYLSLSDATVLTFLSPLTTAFAGYMFLGEVFKRRDALAGVACLFGVILIARPEAIFGPRVNDQDPTSEEGMDPAEKGTSAQRLVAVGVALLGVLGATGAYTSIRAIGKRAHTLHSMTFFSSMCVIAAVAGMIIMHEPVIVPMRIEWLAMLAMIGIFGFLAQALLTMGLQRETAGRGAMAIYVQIIFASILERIFFHTVPSLLSITGTLIILGSALFVAITKQRENPPAHKQPSTSTGAIDASARASTSLSPTSSGSDVVMDLELGLLASARRDDARHAKPGPGDASLSVRDARSKSELALPLDEDETGMRSGPEERRGREELFGIGGVDSDSDSDSDSEMEAGSESEREHESKDKGLGRESGRSQV